MKIKKVVRAWKDPEYRATLENPPESPAGLIELDDVALEGIGGMYDELEASATDTHGCTVSGVTVLSCGWICTLTTECTC